MDKVMEQVWRPAFGLADLMVGDQSIFSDKTKLMHDPRYGQMVLVERIGTEEVPEEEVSNLTPSDSIQALVSLFGSSDARQLKGFGE